MSVAVPTKLSPTQKTALIGEILMAYLRAQVSLARTDLPSTLALLRAGDPREAVDGPRGAYLEGVRLGHVVGRVLRPLPLESRCLMQSLVLTRLLSRRGIPNRLVIGVRPGARFGAHAWVEWEGHPLLPPGLGEFERLVDL